MKSRVSANTLIAALFLVAGLVIPDLTALAATVSIAWDPPIPSNNVIGYKIYTGTASRDYSSFVDVGNSTEGTVPGLDENLTHFFAITAYDDSLNESDYSTELVWDNIPPSISGPDDFTLTADAGGEAQIPDLTGQVEVSDDITSPESIVVSQNPSAGTMVGVGITIVTLTATDEAGNSGNCTVNVTVESGNSAPAVNAGTDRTIILPTSSTWLDATVSDDGLPEGSSVTVEWSMVSGPAAVTFGNQNAVDTNATFSEPGTYLLRLTATDGELPASDTVTVTVKPIPIPMPPSGLRVL